MLRLTQPKQSRKRYFETMKSAESAATKPLLTYRQRNSQFTETGALCN